ncbi:MAG: sugar phosphate isomerase/epimerase [Bryobacteraceae bacterium]
MYTRRDVLRGAAALAAPVALAQKGGWQIGCFTRPWDQVEYRSGLDAIAEAGFRYAGLMSHKGKTRTVITVGTTLEEAATIGEELRKRGLAAISVWGADFGAAKGEAAGVQGLRRLIDCSAACGSPALLLGGTGKPELAGPYYKAVAECCAYAESKGVGLSVKPHGGGNATGPECRKLVESVGQRNFRIWYDPGNIFHYSKGALDPVDDVPALNGLITGVVIKDWKPPIGVMITPGTGNVRWREVMARARKGGFTSGPLVVECLDRGEGSSLVAEARKARRFVEELVAGN